MRVSFGVVHMPVMIPSMDKQLVYFNTNTI